MGIDPLSPLGTPLTICEWIIRIGALFVVPLRRKPEATRSWLLLILFLPIIGLLLYLAIGRPRFPAWRTARFERLAPFRRALALRLLSGRALGGQQSKDIAALVKNLGGWPTTRGNGIEFIDDYDGVISRLVDDIDQARQHVRLLVYIFADDAVGRKVTEALGRAVDRGIPCHVLVDPVGSHSWIRNTIRLLRDAGVETRKALPFHLLGKRTRRDMRNHRKLFLIDGEIGYAGSQNIVAKDFRPGVTNRELTLRVTGPLVAEMTAVFLTDWYLETEVLLDQEPVVPSKSGVAAAQLLPSGPDYPLEGFQTLLVWQVHEARVRIVLTTPYFVPDDGLLGAMRAAVLRGVEIDLIVSAVADQPIVNLAQRSYYEELLGAGIRVHRFRKELLHAKNVSIDGTLAIVGSSNVDIRSFQLNDEVSVLLQDPISVAALEEIQRRYIANSDLLDLAQWRDRSWLGKLAENLARLVSPLL
ncbi:MAG: cardiolipin synthase [Sphingomonadaceae bacterium]|nr:cardiolipin synthase [Sphingomonadaceae bacterium]